ncbi:MAG: MFS transporter [Acidimicrobiales bacterium]
MTRGGEGAVPTMTVVGIALASALVPLNSTMIAVALPDLARDFDISVSEASVLITLYLAAMLVGQPIAGRAADAVGPRRLAIVATTGFGVCSAAAMLAGAFWGVVGFRALQAVFASALVPSVQAMLRALVPDRQRGRAFGVQGSVIGVGAGLGPVIGGIATAAFGWRAIFGVNLPIVLVVLWVLVRLVPVTDRAEHGPDAAGPAGLLNGTFTAAFAVQALSTVAQYALLLAVPIVLDVRGWQEISIGLALAFLTVGMVVAGPFGGRLGDAHGRRRPVVLGLAVTIGAIGASVAGGDDVPAAVLIVTLLVFGLGLGAATPSIQTAGIEAAPAARAGAAAGLLSASRYVGSITSTLVLAGVVEDDGTGLEVLLVVCLASLAIALAVATRLPGRPPVTERTLVAAEEVVPP